MFSKEETSNRLIMPDYTRQREKVIIIIIKKPQCVMPSDLEFANNETQNRLGMKVSSICQPLCFPQLSYNCHNCVLYLQCMLKSQARPSLWQGSCLILILFSYLFFLQQSMMVQLNCLWLQWHRAIIFL